MLGFTGHPLVDVGLATIAAFAGKRDPSALTEADLDLVADYMEKNYTVDPLKSFLTVAFPNSGFTQPAYDKQPEKRHAYAQAVLRAYRQVTPTSDESCVFTGKPAVQVSLDVKGELTPGRAFRQHVPLLTAEGVINFHPYGDAGLPVSGEALLALQAFPLGCAKVAGRLLAVHANDPAVTLKFARRFLQHNRKAIQAAQLAGVKRMPEYPRRPGTLIVEILLELAEEQEEAVSGAVSISAYHLTNSGQGADLQIYHLPLEIGTFLQAAMSVTYRRAWKAVCARGWELSPSKRSDESETFVPRYNVLFEDLFGLPAEAGRFIRRYFLRVPTRQVRPGDPRATYSIREDVALISWDLTELFLREVVHMNQNRIQEIRKLGDALAEYVSSEDDRRFFDGFLMARSYHNLRAALLRVSVARIRRGQAPLVAFDPFIAIFEQGEDLPYSDWRLARDLVLIRMIERLYQMGWLQKHAEELPVPEAIEDQTDTQGESSEEGGQPWLS